MKSDEDALLAAIADRPLDDAPRLVYADWLQERGRDPEADYLRAVVTLMHPPEDAAALARCLAVAPDLDPDWRQQVGGQFEVLLEGNSAMLGLAHMFLAILKLPLGDAINLWQQGHPVRLLASLTREEADSWVRENGPEAPVQGTVRFIIRPMDGATTASLFMS